VASKRVHQKTNICLGEHTVDSVGRAQKSRGWRCNSTILRAWRRLKDGAFQ
jgi:hypothetical protein